MRHRELASFALIGALTLMTASAQTQAAVQEGRFESGMGGDDRTSLRLPANPGILRVSLHTVGQAFRPADPLLSRSSRPEGRLWARWPAPH